MIRTYNKSNTGDSHRTDTAVAHFNLDIQKIQPRYSNNGDINFLNKISLEYKFFMLISLFDYCLIRCLPEICKQFHTDVTFELKRIGSQQNFEYTMREVSKRKR